MILSSFVDDDKFNVKMQPHIDEIYRSIFSNIKAIKRPEEKDWENESAEKENILCFMDKELGIDAIILFENGSFITAQEKSRKYKYYLRFRDFTFEYHSNRFSNPKGKGQWHKLASQLFFYGWANENEDAFVEYYLIDILRLRMMLHNKHSLLIESNLRENDHRASDFYSVNFQRMPVDCIIHFGKPIKTENKELNLQDVFG